MHWCGGHGCRRTAAAGARRLSAIVLGSKTAKVFARSMYRSSSSPREAAYVTASSARRFRIAPQLSMRTMPQFRLGAHSVPPRYAEMLES
jgi:hypothetical protein